jgi:P4 family phage/plasmid primase-like protien
MSDENNNNLSIKNAAREYRDKGLAVCRLGGGKKPANRGWTTRSAVPEEFRPGDNVGLVCGWLSDGGVAGRFLVCVDLDAREAVEKAPQFLPATGAVEGRKGNPGSHWWYFVTDVPEWAVSKAPQAAAAAVAAGAPPGPFKKPFNHAQTGERLIDFQGTGGQAVVPPSLHESSGEVRRWEEGCSSDRVATVPFAELWDAVCRLALACGGSVPDIGSPADQEDEAEVGPADETDEATPQGEASEPVAPPSRAAGARARDCHLPMAERERLATDYVREKAPLARSGKGGHKTTFRVARVVVNDYAVADREAAVRVLRAYNQRLGEEKEETWGEDQLAHKVDDALAAPDDPRFPFGCKLTGPPDDEKPDPCQLAEAFVQGSPVLFLSGRYFVYNGRHYDEVDAGTLKARVWSFLEGAGVWVTRAVRDNVLAAIEARGVARLSGCSQDVSFNAWAPSTGRSGDTLVVRNGLLDVATGKLSPHTPDFLGLYCLPYDYDPAAACPTWVRFVDRVCGGDADLVKLIRQWFGYCLTTSTDEQKFLVLVGVGANGKSTLVGGLLAVVGEANASHVTLEKFSGTFDLGYTLGKLVNVSDDMSEIDKANEGVLKTYTSGGAMSFNQKNRPILSARPTAKLTFCTNTVPRFGDRSDGLWRRLLLVPLGVVIPEGERVKGLDKPAHWASVGETAGMLNWALEGLRSLRAEGGFAVPACVRTAVDEHQLESNPTRVFLTEHLEPAPDECIPSRSIYDYYRRWMEENGHKPMAHVSLSKELIRIHKGTKSESKRIKLEHDCDRDQVRLVKVITGIRWTLIHDGWVDLTPQGSVRLSVPVDSPPVQLL